MGSTMDNWKHLAMRMNNTNKQKQTQTTTLSLNTPLRRATACPVYSAAFQASDVESLHLIEEAWRDKSAEWIKCNPSN